MKIRVFKCLLLLGMQLKESQVQMSVAARYATNQIVEFKCLRSPVKTGLLFSGGNLSGYWTLLFSE